MDLEKVENIPTRKPGIPSLLEYDDDEYAYRTPNPKHRHKYTKVKVLHTQGKHTQLKLSIFTWHCCLADANPPEYVNTHSLWTGYLRP